MLDRYPKRVLRKFLRKAGVKNVKVLTLRYDKGYSLIMTLRPSKDRSSFKGMNGQYISSVVVAIFNEKMWSRTKSSTLYSPELVKQLPRWFLDGIS